MTIRRILRNKLVFGLFPILIMIGLYFYFNDLIYSMVPEKSNLILVLLLLALLILFLDIIKDWKRLKIRNSKLQSSLLEKVPNQVEFSKRFNFLDKTIIVDDNGLGVKSNNSLILHLNQKSKIIDIINDFKNKSVKFDDVEFIFLEYDQYQSYMPRIWIGVSTGHDKTVYKNSLIAKLKNGKEIRLFVANLKDSDKGVNEEYFLKGEYNERTYLNHGEKLIRLFSYYAKKEYLVIDNI